MAYVKTDTFSKCRDRKRDEKGRDGGGGKRQLPLRKGRERELNGQSQSHEIT